MRNLIDIPIFNIIFDKIHGQLSEQTQQDALYLLIDYLHGFIYSATCAGELGKTLKTEEVTRPISTWAGLRTFAPDRTLVLGPDPDCPNFVWSAGQGGYGFQTAPAASQLVADRVLGRPSELPADVVAALSPARFR